MKIKLKDFAGRVKGIIQGDPEIELTGVSGIAEAKEGDITFVSSAKFAKEAHKSKASCIMVKELLPDINTCQLRISNPYWGFAKALEYFFPRPSFVAGISELAAVSETAQMGKDVHVSPFAYLSDDVLIEDGTVIMQGVFIGEKTKIGRHCIVYPNVVIREGTTIGDNVIVHSGTVIGSDGFAYVFEGGEHYKIPQVGGVIIEDNVEIGSNVSIDRATTGNTVIGRGTKIDNLVQIGHNVRVGRHCIIVSEVGIGGSSELGDYVTLAGQAGLADHTFIESGTIITAQAGMLGRVHKGTYSGYPAMPHREWLRAQALVARLPEMNKKIKELEDKINKLERGTSE